MKEIPRISESEWEVLGILWKKAPLTANQVFDKLTGGHRKFSTVRTFLARLEKKGVIGSHDSGGAKTYSPLVGSEECVQQETRSFLERVFAGSAAPMLMHFVKEADLSPAELKELRRIIKQKEGR